MGHSALFTSILLSLVGWAVAETMSDATEETIILRNHLLPGVDYERDPAPAPHLVLVTNSGDGRPPVFQLDTVHMNMAEQYGVLGVVAPSRNQDGQRNPGGQTNPDDRRNPGNRRNPDGQRNPEGQRNPGSRRNADMRRRNEDNRYRSEQTEELHRFNWWRL